MDPIRKEIGSSNCEIEVQTSHGEAPSFSDAKLWNDADTRMLVSIRVLMNEQFQSTKSQTTLWNVVHRKLLEGGGEMFCATSTEQMKKYKTSFLLCVRSQQQNWRRTEILYIF